MTPEQYAECQTILRRARAVGAKYAAPRAFWDDVLAGRPVDSLLDPAELRALALMRLALIAVGCHTEPGG